MNRNSSFSPKTLLIATFLLLLTAFALHAQKRLTDFYSTDLSTEVPTNFIEFNGKAYFMATDVTHGRNLWTSDGTKNGTRFFLETEPTRPEINATYYFKTDSILYVFSNQNLWQIDKKHNAKQLNSQPLVVSRKFNNFDNKLFFNAIEYFDLKSKSFQKIAINDPKSLINDNLRNYNECSHGKLRAFSFYGNNNDKDNKFYVLEPNQNAYTALSLGFPLSSGVPSNIYKLKGNYFGAIEREGIYKFSQNKVPQKVSFFSGLVLYQNQVEEKLYILTSEGSQTTQYVFDGEKLEQISNKIYEWKGISRLKQISNDSLFYSTIRYNSGENKIQFVQLDKLGELAVKLTLPDGSNLGSIVEVLNDSLFSFAHSLVSDNIFQKTTIVNFKKFTVKFIELGEFALLPNGEFIGQRLKESSKGRNLSIFNLNKNEFLINTFSTKSRPKSLGMWFDILNKTLFVGLNEYDNLKSIYAFKCDSDQGKRILAQQDSSFNIRTQTNINGGNQIGEDIQLYATDSDKNISQIYDYTIDYTLNNNYNSFPKIYIYDHLKNTTVQVKKSNKPIYQLYQISFEIDEDKIREVNSTYRNTLKTYYFPTKFQENRVFQLVNQFYFWGKEGGEFENQLFIFDGIENTFKRIVNEPVQSVHSFKNLPVVVLKTGQVRIMDTKNAFENYFVMNIELDEKQFFSFKDNGNFFFINTQNRVYYSDGDCQNSGLIDVPQRDGFWGVERIHNSDFYLLGNQSERFIGKGRNINPFPSNYSGIIGLSNKNVYYGLAIEDRSQGVMYKTVIYQYNLAIAKTTLIDTIYGYFAYYTDVFRVLEKEKKWEFIIGNKQYTITDISKDADKIGISQFSNYAYSETIFRGKNNNTLLTSGKELILKNNVQNTILMTLKPDEYWQSNFNSVYYQQSEEYIYLSVLTISNNIGLVKKVIRISKQDFTIKTIDVPFGVRVFRTSSDTAPYYPILLGAERLYAIIESPNEGRQLWLLDEAKQTQKVPDYTSQREIIEEFIGNKDCATARLNQLIPTEKVEQYGIFPNPTSKYLFLNLPKDQRQSIEKMEIYDTLGRLISNQITQNSFSINPDLISLNLPDLPTGLYFLKVNLSSTSLNFKFVVE